MIRIYKLVTIVLLVFNVIGAFYGGINLILHPDGSSIGLSLDVLKHKPFNDFLIPGILLLAANGLFGLVVLATVLINYRKYPWFLMAQGVILSAWIVIQVGLIQTIFFLHYLLGGIGIALIILGRLQHVQKRNFE